MNHLPELIQDLSLILMVAAVVTLLFKKLRQPVVLGYLIAGFLVGPNFDLFPTIKEIKSISIWAEMGVIFMLFGLGLEFSFKTLSKVGKSAFITAGFEIVAMIVFGYLAGQILRWSKMDSLYLGGILSISSTTIIVKAFDELNLKGKAFVPLVFGVLIVEDLIAILLLVILSSVAATQSLSGVEMWDSTVRLGFFLILWFVLGIYLLPLILKQIMNLLTDETLLIVSIGLCLMMVLIANYVGFSPALGSFVMGSLLAETSKGPKIEHLIQPVKNLFAAIFFVSVGMLINPKILYDQFRVIIVISIVTIIGKFLSTTIGALISGKPFKTSVQTGLSLAQIGEFSFIIATLGMTLKVTSDILYPIAVAVSAITTFTTPYLIQFSEIISEKLEEKLPWGIRAALSRYDNVISVNTVENILTTIWRTYGIKVLLNSILVVAITLAIKHFLTPHLIHYISVFSSRLISCIFAVILSIPFLWAIFFGTVNYSNSFNTEAIDRIRRLQFGITYIRFFIGCSLIGFVIGEFTTMLALPGMLLVSLITLGLFFFSRFSEPIYLQIERRFIANLSVVDRQEIEKKSKIPELAPWNATIAEFIISPNSAFILKTLKDCGIKETFGVVVVMIERGDNRILAPRFDDQLLPYDKLYLIGSEEQLSAIQKAIEVDSSIEFPPIEETLGLSSLFLNTKNLFINKSIRECGLREAVNGLIVGIERDGIRILNPDSSLKLKVGDLVWIVGDKDLVKKLR